MTKQPLQKGFQPTSVPGTEGLQPTPVFTQDGVTPTKATGSGEKTTPTTSSGKPK